MIQLGGTEIVLRSHANNNYVCAESGGSAPLIGNRGVVGPWETFQLINNNDGTVSLRSRANERIVTAEGGGNAPLVANRSIIGLWEKFRLEPIGTPPPGPGGLGPSSPSDGLVPAGYPTAVTTGPRRADLRDSGSITVSQSGTVISGLRVRGTITVAASNVTIRDTLVQGGGNGYPIRVAKGARNVLIEYVEVDNLDDTGIGIYFNGGSGTVRYADIHSAEDGIRVQADDVVIEYSFIHDLHRYSGGHHDSIQIREGNNVTIRGNSLLPYVSGTGDPMNAAIQIGSLLNDPLENLQVERNFMDGGNYTINGGRASDIGSARFTDNIFGPHARYGVKTGLSNSIWTNNRWMISNERIP